MSKRYDDADTPQAPAPSRSPRADLEVHGPAAPTPAPTPAVVPPGAIRPEVAGGGAEGRAPERAPHPSGLSDSRIPPPRRALLDSRREAVIERLQRAFGDGELTMAEYDQRLDLAETARVEAEIDVLVADLPSPPELVEAPTSHLPVPAPRRELVTAADAALAKRPLKLLAVFGGSERKGEWVVPAKVKARAVFGGIDLDFRHARLTSAITEVHCVATFGGVDVIVPPDVRVEVAGNGVFGGFDGPDGAGPDGAPIIRVSGTAVFGGVDVVVRDDDGKKIKKVKRKKRRKG